MSFLRRYRRHLGVLAVLALAARLAVGVAMSASVPAVVAVGLAAVLGPVPMCAAHDAGSAGAEPEPTGDPSPGPADHCPVCTLLAAFTLAIAVMLVGLILPPPWRPAPPRHSGRLHPLHAGLGRLRSRGPPVPA